MKKLTHCLVLTAIIGGAPLFGLSAWDVSDAAASPTAMLRQQAALTTPDAPETTTSPEALDSETATIGFHQAIRVPTPAEVSAGGSASSPASNTVPPLEISAAEARQWIVDAGYSDVSALTLATTTDGVPVYRGTAMADGESYAVIVDSWGNIAGWQ